MSISISIRLLLQIRFISLCGSWMSSQVISPLENFKRVNIETQLKRKLKILPSNAALRTDAKKLFVRKAYLSIKITILCFFEQPQAYMPQDYRKKFKKWDISFTRDLKILPFLHPNIVHGEGAITSDAIRSGCAPENTVQSGNIYM